MSRKHNSSDYRYQDDDVMLSEKDHYSKEGRKIVNSIFSNLDLSQISEDEIELELDDETLDQLYS